ncbi:MAG: hypothetical protein PUB51_04990, partial [Oscillospiraceae bacterium]|nr:hypothetical protein [Oscillospiraceae bacterium]
GPLHFSSEEGVLACEHCESTFTVPEVEELYREKDESAAEAFRKANENPTEAEWDASDITEDWGEEAEHMRAYTCPSCGAQLICDDTTAATSCPYCDNPTIVPGQFDGALRPDYVIPFKLDKKAAIAALKEHYKKRPFLPRAFSDRNHLEEIRGVYVPFWLFDGEAEADFAFHAANSITHREGDYRVTNTSHFDVRRSGVITFEKVPADASRAMDDDYMDSLEPYDYAELTKFSTAYLPGYLANRYDVSVEENTQRAGRRVVNTAEAIMRGDVSGYAMVSTTRNDVYVRGGKVHYALLPVWILNTNWAGKHFVFAMNGQTGKLVGDLPVSKGRFWGLCAAITAGLGVISSALFLLLR